MKMVSHYNLTINHKDEIEINEVHNYSDVINEQSLIGDDLIFNNLIIEQQMQKLEKLCITNNVKTKWGNDTKMRNECIYDIDFYEQEVMENLVIIDQKLTQKNLMNKIEIR